MKKNMIFRQNKKNLHIFILFKSFHPRLLMHVFSSGASVGLGTYRSLLNRYLEFGTCTDTQRYLFSVLYSLCNNKNIYFSEQNKSKTLNFNILNNRALQFLIIFFLTEILVLFFSDTEMKAWNIYLFLIKLKWNPFIFWQTNRGLLLKLIHGRKIVWIFL